MSSQDRSSQILDILLSLRSIEDYLMEELLLQGMTEEQIEEQLERPLSPVTQIQDTLDDIEMTCQSLVLTKAISALSAVAQHQNIVRGSDGHPKP